MGTSVKPKLIRSLSIGGLEELQLTGVSLGVNKRSEFRCDSVAQEELLQLQQHGAPAAWQWRQAGELQVLASL